MINTDHSKEESIVQSLYSAVKRTLGKAIQYLKHKEQSLGQEDCCCSPLLTGPGDRKPLFAPNIGTANNLFFPSPTF